VIALWASAAAAAAPSGSFAVMGQASALERPAWEAAGVAATFGQGLGDRVALELGLDAGAAGAGGLYSAGRLGWRIGGAADTAPRASAVLAYGVAWAGELRPTGAAALALDLGDHPTRSWRVQGGAISDGLRLAGLQLTVGIARRPAAPPPPPPPPPPPVEPPAAPTVQPLAISPDGAMVWLPHPWCRWMPVEGGVLETPPDLAGDPARVSAPGYRAESITLGDAAALSLDPVQPQGALVVVAHPGDRLRTGEAELAAGADGVAVVRAPSGRVEVEVVGSGRRATLVAAVSTDHVTWVRAPDPEPLVVRFAVGDARLDPASGERLRSFADAAGGAAFRVAGGASPEGDADANAALARERAATCADALRRAGIADDRITTLDLPQISDSADDPADARTCIVTPRAPKGRR